MTTLYFIYTNVLDKKNFEGLAYLMSKLLLHIGFKKLFFVWQKRGLEKHHSTQKKRLQLMCVYSMLKFFEFARLERGTASQVRRQRAPHITL